MPSAGKVYIVGFMGSGKTTAGKKLSEALGWTFADLDQAIEQREKRTIGKIFSESGESYFRKAESECLREYENHDRFVISTGGGAPCFADNLEFMKRTGIVVYLRMDPVSLVERLEGEQDSRPLIRDLDRGGLELYIIEKLKERETFYNCADIIVDGRNPDITSLAERIRNFS
jgi:shikimate kinase